MPKKLSHASRVESARATEEYNMQMCQEFCEAIELQLPDPVPTNSRDFARAIRKAVKDPCIKEDPLYELIKQISSSGRDR